MPWGSHHGSSHPSVPRSLLTLQSLRTPELHLTTTHGGPCVYVFTEKPHLQKHQYLRVER